jgi:SAM-dependent methyltransferase
MMSPRIDMSSRSYREDLARVHATGFSRFGVTSTREIVRRLRAQGIRSGDVVELGCGAGASARVLSRAGFGVIGIDASAAMIARARDVAPRARFRRASIDEVEIPRCAAVTAVGEVLSYVSGVAQRARRARLFRRVARSLATDGMFLFDVLVEGEPPMNYRTFVRGRGWFVLVEVAEDVGRARVRRDITTIVRAGRAYRARSEVHVLEVFRVAALVRELERAGFAVETARAYGRVRLPERRLAFLARKVATRGARRPRAKS